MMTEHRSIKCLHNKLHTVGTRATQCTNGTRAVLCIPVSSLFPVLFLHVPFIYLYIIIYTSAMLSILGQQGNMAVL